MARSLALVAGWLLAAGAALGVAWQGVAIVGDQVTDHRPAPLTASELAEGGEAPPSSTSTSTSGSPTTQVPPSSTTPASSTPEAEPPAGETRTYNLIGGSAALRFEPTGVTVLWATPHAGFGVEIEPQQGNGRRVEFESESHRSRVEGWWANGPEDRVREEGDNGGGDGGGSGSG